MLRYFAPKKNWHVPTYLLAQNVTAGHNLLTFFNLEDILPYEFLEGKKWYEISDYTRHCCLYASKLIVNRKAYPGSNPMTSEFTTTTPVL
jgi:hypothetical protein